jgi:hypothetical protein
MDKAESREFRGMTLVVFSLKGDQWQNSARYGVHSDRFSPPILGWVVKSEIWHWYCFHAGCCCSHEGRKWLAVALNGECGGSTGSTQGRASHRFLGDQGVPSSEPHVSRNVVEAFRSSFRLVPS